MIDTLNDAPRLILRAQLQPTAGSSFQPTGFPDLGAAEFERPSANGDDTGKSLLVESVQSLANHLESSGWDAVEQEPVTALQGLPYVAVEDKEGRFLTSSRLEPHRLAGAYIRQAKIDGEDGDIWLIDQVGAEKGVPIDWRSLYETLFQLDPLCLLHGVFFSSPKWKDLGNPKVRRAVTAVIEAHGVRPVVSGGVKRDDVSPTAKKGRDSSDGFGFVPFGRTEYTAAEIEMAIVVDLEQIRGYGLGDTETELLTAVALWEIGSLLSRPLRLRTACDLELVDEVAVGKPKDWKLPKVDELEAAIAGAGVTFDRAAPTAAVFE